MNKLLKKVSANSQLRQIFKNYGIILAVFAMDYLILRKFDAKLKYFSS